VAQLLEFTAGCDRYLAGMASRDLPEVHELDFERDSARADAGALAVAPYLVDDVSQLISCRLVREEIGRKSVLSANGFPYAIGADGPLVDAARRPVIIGSRFPKMLLQEFLGLH